MKLSIISIVVLFVVSILLFGVPHNTDASGTTFVRMLQVELSNTQKNPHEITRVFEPIGRASGNVGETDIRLTEVGLDYFCGMHSGGVKECWRDEEVVSVQFLIMH